jgi:hypothetical protein
MRMAADTSILCPVFLGGSTVGLVDDVPKEQGGITGNDGDSILSRNREVRLEDLEAPMLLLFR